MDMDATLQDLSSTPAHGGHRTTAWRSALVLLAALVAGICALALPAAPAFAEGSVDVNVGPGGSTRHGLGVANPGGGIRSPLQVYAQAGETVHLATSLMGLGAANIRVFAPGADPFTATPLLDCAASQPGAGRIASRAQEQAGPLPNVGGYDACDFAVPATGAYVVVFDGADSTNGLPGTVDTPSTTIAQGRNASMWDVTVRSAGGVAQPGRLFSRNIQFRTASAAGAAAEFQAYVYTRTGYQYRVNLYEHSGVNWILAPDDLGVVDAASGERIFASFACGDEADPNVNRPCVHFEADLAPADRRYPVFINAPDPLAISGPGGLAETLGYATAPIAPSTRPVSQPAFTGAGGESGATSRGQGGTVSFTTPVAMQGLPYDFVVDLDRDGVFGDAGDFVDENEELAADGANAYRWSGLDADGAAPACGTYDYEISTTLSEVHFVRQDAENSGGIRIERLSLPADPDLGDPLAASYDNNDPYKPGFVVTNGTPAEVTNGISGPTFNGWDANTGNTDYVDTWTQLPEIAVTGTLHLSCADLAIAKAAPATVGAGERVTWTLTVTNHGPDASTSATVSDAIPAGVTDVSAATPGCLVAAGSVTCAVGSLAPGASTQVALSGDAPSARTCVTNVASVQGALNDPNPANDSASAQTCTLLSDVSIAKTASDRRVIVGESLTYTLVVRNAGPDATADTRVSDPVPDHLDVQRAATRDGRCEVARNAVTCALGSLNVGEEVRIEVRARAVRAGGVVNVAEVSDPRCAAEPCDSDPARVRVVKPRLRLAKQVARRVLRAGETTRYTIRVTNPSDVRLRNVRTCDRLPAGLVFVSADPRAHLSNGRHCWTTRRLPAGASRAFRVTVRALPGASGRLVNTATASSPDAGSARATRAVRVIGGQVAAGGVTG